MSNGISRATRLKYFATGETSCTPLHPRLGGPRCLYAQEGPSDWALILARKGTHEIVLCGNAHFVKAAKKAVYDNVVRLAGQDDPGYLARVDMVIALMMAYRGQEIWLDAIANTLRAISGWTPEQVISATKKVKEKDYVKTITMFDL